MYEVNLCPGFRDLPELMVAVGDSAKEAFAALLDKLALEGLGTADVSRNGRAMHLESEDAEIPAVELVDDEDEEVASDVVYLVGIRYADPRIVDAEEVEAGDDEDDEDEGKADRGA